MLIARPDEFLKWSHFFHQVPPSHHHHGTRLLTASGGKESSSIPSHHPKTYRFTRCNAIRLGPLMVCTGAVPIRARHITPEADKAQSSSTKLLPQTANRDAADRGAPRHVETGHLRAFSLLLAAPHSIPAQSSVGDLIMSSRSFFVLDGRIKHLHIPRSRARFRGACCMRSCTPPHLGPRGPAPLVPNSSLNCSRRSPYQTRNLAPHRRPLRWVSCPTLPGNSQLMPTSERY